MDLITNYDEAHVPAYALPDPLRLAGGSPLAHASQWWGERRDQILALFQQYVYGRTPSAAIQAQVQVIQIDEDAPDGRAVRKEICLRYENQRGHVALNLLIYLPQQTAEPVPLFLGLNFFGNHAIHPDPQISLSTQWMRESQDHGIRNHRATEASRGSTSSRWDVDQVLDRGYGLATLYCGDMDPDFDDGYRNGVHPLFYREGQTLPQADEWGTLGAWAWGLSRALDYLETDEAVDHDRVAVMGHSRLGKAALWAGAQDPRVALVVSNNSGCGGAALSRRRFGETVAHIINRFPHWFCDNFRQFNHNEDALPVDQHMLLALIAPRPLYVASAVEDLWADPRGEFLAVRAADPVYRLLGHEGIPVQEMPPVGQPVAGRMGYHLRAGGHDVTDYDWTQFLNFADSHFGA